MNGAAALTTAAPRWEAPGPGTLERRTLRDLQKRLLSLRGEPLAVWLAQAPLVPRLDERAGLLALDRSIKADLGAVEAVCARPRSHLSYEIDRVPAPRVRRVPPRALMHLAAHTEDWDRTTLVDVKPRRLLAEQREERLDQYENRVTARLIDHLERYLRQRRDEVAKVLGILDEFQRAQDEAAQGSHRRQHRLFTLFADSLDADPLRQRALRTQADLQALWRRVAALRATSLYQAIPARAQVGATLRMTNVLANDPLYLRVAQLYLACQRDNPRPTPEELRTEEAAAALGFRDFALLVLLRALTQLGYQPGDTTAPVSEGAALTFAGPSGAVMLRWTPTEITLFDQESPQALLQVEARPMALLGTAEEDLPVLSAMLDLRLRDEQHRPSLPERLLLHLGVVPTPPRVRPLQARLLGLGGAGLTAISPWELSSVERVARLLRRWLLAPRLLAYPPRVATPPKEVPAILESPPWLVNHEGGWALVRPPNGSPARRHLDERHADLRGRLQTVMAEWQEAQEARQDGKNDRRALGRANLDKSQAVQRLRAIEEEEGRLRTFLESLRQAEAALARLRTCPICGATNLRQEAQQGEFRCRCAECDGSFGTRRCACGQRFATLWPGSAWPPAAGSPDAVDWVDRLVGCDVVALPCPVTHGAEPTFLCPSCGACPGCQSRAF